MVLGNAKSLFGADFDQLTGAGIPTTVSVKQHSRVRIIGQPASQVSAHTYTYIQWPTSEAAGARGGKVIEMQWDGSEGTWTGRVTGSMAALGTFLDTSQENSCTFRTQAGTKYGPFNKPEES